MGDRVDDSRFLFVVVLVSQSVSHDILEPGDVSDVRRKLADERELVALAVGDGVAGL